MSFARYRAIAPRLTALLPVVAALPAVYVIGWIVGS